MPSEPKPVDETVDEIDRRILSILSESPRLPYSEISKRLAEMGIELSSEAVRQRVSSLFDITTSFFLVRPDSYEWVVMMVVCRTTDSPGAKAEAFERISGMDYWFVGRGFGTLDIYAVATVESSRKIDDLLTETRCLEAVESMDYFIETGRSTAVERYLRVE
jgi:DNA-binding Lrp family transcriptional regulator